MFTTEGYLKKFKTYRILAILLISLSILLLATKDFSSGFSFRLVGSALDALLMFAGGLFFFFFVRKSFRELAGNKVVVNENGFEIHSNGATRVFDASHAPKSLEVKLNSIEVVTVEGQTINIMLNYYTSDFSARKEMKKDFEVLKDRLFPK